MNKTVIMLIGPKGSGKTHIGTVIEKKANIPFLRVEPIWLSLGPGIDGWNEVELAVDAVLAGADSVVIESLGVSDGFQRLRKNLASKYDIKFVRVVASLKTCLRRVRRRDKANRIPVSDGEVEKYNRISSR